MPTIETNPTIVNPTTEHSEKIRCLNIYKPLFMTNAQKRIKIL